MVNFPVDPELILRAAPAGTEPDWFEGETWASIVGFLFLNARVRGLAVPFHRNFEEVNLRVYVRRRWAGEERRAVAFVQELVPKRAIAWTARALYNEQYRVARMGHSLRHEQEGLELHFDWSIDGARYELSVDADARAKTIAEGSAEEFFTEHYWGYAAQRDGGTVEYEVRHPRWRVFPVRGYALSGDWERLYGAQWARELERGARSVLLAEGSEVRVSAGRRIET